MRVEQWEKRLAAIIDSGKRVPFQWGVRDCALFAAACVFAVTQKNPAAGWFGKYHDEAGALAFIEADGGLVALAEAGMRNAGINFERIPVKLGQRGDPCLVRHERGESLAVIEGASWVAQGPLGLVRQPYDTALMVWAIR